jgi:hypothetical protein
VEEQRAHSRKLMHEQASVANASGTSWAPTIMLNISFSGVCFACSEVMESGELRQLRFRLPGKPDTHNVFVQIVHRTPHGVPAGYKYGARFMSLDTATTAQILDFVSKTAN